MTIRELLTNEIPDYLVIVEADESVQETIKQHEVKYYLSSNLENMTVTWLEDDKSIQISGSINRSEIENIITSMEAVTNEKN